MGSNGGRNGGSSVRMLAGYVLLSAGSVVIPYAAPFTAALLWYRGYDWRAASDGSRRRLSVVLLVLAAAMTVYAVVAVTGAVTTPGFENVPVVRAAPTTT